MSCVFTAHCFPGTRMGVLFMEDSVSVNNHCLDLRVQSPQIPSWIRRAEDEGSPLLILISCLGIQWKPMSYPQKWERKHHHTVSSLCLSCSVATFYFSSPPPSLLGTDGWIWQTDGVIWGKHKPQWNSKYETFIHLSLKQSLVESLLCLASKPSWMSSHYSFNFQGLGFNCGIIDQRFRFGMLLS